MYQIRCPANIFAHVSNCTFGRFITKKNSTAMCNICNSTACQSDTNSPRLTKIRVLSKHNEMSAS